MTTVFGPEPGKVVRYEGWNHPFRPRPGGRYRRIPRCAECGYWLTHDNHKPAGTEVTQ